MKIRKAKKKDFIIFGICFTAFIGLSIYGALHNNVSDKSEENPQKIIELGKCDDRGCFIQLENGDSGYMPDAKVGLYACKLKGLSDTRYYQCGN